MFSYYKANCIIKAGFIYMHTSRQVDYCNMKRKKKKKKKKIEVSR